MALHAMNDLLDSALSQIDAEFQRERGWDLVKRNQAITARNRNMRKICDMLGMEFKELPLERSEQAA